MDETTSLDGLANTTLIIFTSCYPFAISGDSFLEEELLVISPFFKKIILIPCNKESETILPVPSNVQVEVGFYTLYQKAQGWRAFQKIPLGLLFSFLIKNGFGLFFNRNQFLFDLKFFIKKNLLLDWLNHREQSVLFLEKTFLYSYWLDFQATAIGAFSTNKVNCKAVSRAHGYDYVQTAAFRWPERIDTVRNLDLVLPASNFGVQAIQATLADTSLHHKIRTSNLGSKNFHLENYLFSPAGNLHVLSTAIITPNKRIDFIFACLQTFALAHPRLKVHWTHFGSGVLFDKEALEKVLHEKPLNFTFSLKGEVKLQEILDFYQKETLDLYINMSRREGGRPVSIMEAQSFGKPVIAPTVGGIPEILSNETGVLLCSDPSMEEVVAALTTFIPLDNRQKKGTAARANFCKHYDAKAAFSDFAHLLATI